MAKCHFKNNQNPFIMEDDRDEASAEQIEYLLYVPQIFNDLEFAYDSEYYARDSLRIKFKSFLDTVKLYLGNVANLLKKFPVQK